MIIILLSRQSKCVMRRDDLYLRKLGLGIAVVDWRLSVPVEEVLRVVLRVIASRRFVRAPRMRVPNDCWIRFEPWTFSWYVKWT